MPKGIVRSIIGGLALAFAANVAQTVDEYKSLSPNELASRRITEEQRVAIAPIREAVTQKTGPVYDQLSTYCRDEERKFTTSRTEKPYTTQALIGNATFNAANCLSQELNEKAAIVRSVPERHMATNEYKASVISTTNDNGLAAGVAGTLLLFSGLMSATATRKGYKAPTNG